ncbi:hypothetical protein P691DRAFT_799651 [Macrolepiota fuliginosa MF-IS2]|uniref:DUF2828 domain-containing protein n=1 Tax=Macrolepiota fuliginosa MF-IS2 TaxID=1400762 RepID=A0A9P5XNC4_9AGAR|nr:hypothetical protein P691DRAFT_799651 [Macrolepiota fuliginosa MF-IS2]
MTALMADNHTFTENLAPAFKSTGSATLDAFNGLNAWSFEEVNQTLEKSWAEDSYLTLRIIWNIRSIHDGKGEKELFYRSFGWLYDNHPRTAISNLHMLVTPVDVARPHGYWKDLLHILALATCGELSNISSEATFLHNYTPKSTNHESRLAKGSRTPKQVKAFEEQTRKRATQKRKDLHQQFYERLVGKLTSDPTYRALYIAVVRLFAGQLRKDIKILEELKAVDRKEDKQRYYKLLKSISLAGKWAPTPGGSHDRVTNISTAVCQLLFSPNENAGPNAIGPLPSAAPFPIPTDRNNCLILRRYYAHWLLKPLREIIACPEPLMSANRWTEIRYTRVPSVCMATNKARFFEHDPEGFQQFLFDVESGKKRVSGAALMPHELVAEAMRLRDESRQSQYSKLAELKKNAAEQELKVVNAQWQSLVSRMKESGNLDNCLAICDVSGSMGSVGYYNKRRVSPIFPSVSLSLMLASLAKPPFNAGFITFSANPQFVRLENLEETSLDQIVATMVKAPWGMNTNFQAVFLKLLLPLAKQHNIAKDDMVKRIFVFSDMQFDAASRESSTWETNHDLVEKAYKEAGYDVPEIVYWNLAGHDTTAVTVEVGAEKAGVAMMSGFSASMMKVFMGEAEEAEDMGWEEVSKEGDVVKKKTEFTPLNIMKRALLRKSYDGLVVVD